MNRRIGSPRAPVALVGLGWLVVGCASGDAIGDGPADGEGTRRVYALNAIVFNPDDTATSYVVLSDTPNIREVSLAGAREFAGRISIAPAGGRLYVGKGEEPVVERYSFTDSLEWIDEGSLSFANQGLQEARLESLVDGEAAYAPRGEWDPFRAVWDPTGLAITGERARTVVPLKRDGFDGRWAGTPFDIRRGPPLRSVIYDDGDMFEMTPSTTVVVYDAATHEEADAFEVPCPGMYLGREDEQGNTYMTSVASPVLALYGKIRGSCARRVRSDGTLDPDWAPDLAQWTGGRQLGSFDYASAGKAIGNVLHHEELEALGADFSAAYDPDVFDEGQNGNHYRAWLFDFEAERARPISGVEQGVQTNVIELDGRMFLDVSYDEWTRARFYEVDADGSATFRFEVPAYVEDWVRVR